MGFGVAGVADAGAVAGIAAESLYRHVAHVRCCAAVAAGFYGRAAKIRALAVSQAELTGGAAIFLAHALPVAAGVVAALGMVGRTERRLRVTAGRTADGELIGAGARPIDRYLDTGALDRFRGRSQAAGRIGVRSKCGSAHDGSATETQEALQQPPPVAPCGERLCECVESSILQANVLRR